MGASITITHDVYTLLHALAGNRGGPVPPYPSPYNCQYYMDSPKSKEELWLYLSCYESFHIAIHPYCKHTRTCSYYEEKQRETSGKADYVMTDNGFRCEGLQEVNSLMQNESQFAYPKNKQLQLTSTVLRVISDTTKCSSHWTDTHSTVTSSGG